nr:ChbG/HpnK family deacetylase [uncultured Fluviicola sp.]
MASSKIILTTDDFGVDDSIDNGIIQLVNFRIVHSVEILVNKGENGAESIRRTELLLDSAEGTNPELELGVHLTITSGKPVSNANLSEILFDGHFISAKNTNSAADKAAIYTELKAQIEILKSNDRIWKKVTHLTNHHDALWFFPKYTEAYIQVAQEYGLPIRNPRVMPTWSALLYYKYIGPRNASEEDLNQSKRAYDFRQLGQFETRDLEYRSTHYLDSSHYSLWRTIIDSNPYKTDEFIAQRQERLRELFKKVRETHDELGVAQMVEVLLHVREGSVKDSKVKLPKNKRNQAFDKFDLEHYNGISTTYFDGRAIEYYSLLWENTDGSLSRLFTDNQIERGRWSDCIEQKLSKP